MFDPIEHLISLGRFMHPDELKTETQIRCNCEQYEIDNIGIFPNLSTVSILLQTNPQKVAFF